MATYTPQIPGGERDPASAIVPRQPLGGDNIIDAVAAVANKIQTQVTQDAVERQASLGELAGQEAVAAGASVPPRSGSSTFLNPAAQAFEKSARATFAQRKQLVALRELQKVAADNPLNPTEVQRQGDLIHADAVRDLDPEDAAMVSGAVSEVRDAAVRKIGTDAITHYIQDNRVKWESDFDETRGAQQRAVTSAWESPESVFALRDAFANADVEKGRKAWDAGTIDAEQWGQIQQKSWDYYTNNAEDAIVEGILRSSPNPAAAVTSINEVYGQINAGDPAWYKHPENRAPKHVPAAFGENAYLPFVRLLERAVRMRREGAPVSLDNEYIGTLIDPSANRGDGVAWGETIEEDDLPWVAHWGRELIDPNKQDEITTKVAELDVYQELWGSLFRDGFAGIENTKNNFLNSPRGTDAEAINGFTAATIKLRNDIAKSNNQTVSGGGRYGLVASLRDIPILRNRLPTPEGLWANMESAGYGNAQIREEIKDPVKRWDYFANTMSAQAINEGALAASLPAGQAKARDQTVTDVGLVAPEVDEFYRSSADQLLQEVSEGRPGAINEFFAVTSSYREVMGNLTPSTADRQFDRLGETGSKMKLAYMLRKSDVKGAGPDNGTTAATDFLAYASQGAKLTDANQRQAMLKEATFRTNPDIERVNMALTNGGAGVVSLSKQLDDVYVGARLKVGKDRADGFMDGYVKRMLSQTKTLANGRVVALDPDYWTDDAIEQIDQYIMPNPGSEEYDRLFERGGGAEGANQIMLNTIPIPTPDGKSVDMYLDTGTQPEWLTDKDGRGRRYSLRGTFEKSAAFVPFWAPQLGDIGFGETKVTPTPVDNP